MKRMLIALAALTAGFFAGSWIVVATIGNKNHGWQGLLGGIFWFGFLACAAALVVAALVALVRSRLRRSVAVTTIAVVVLAGAAFAAQSHAQSSAATRITVVVPIASIRAADPSKSVGHFRESYVPKRPAAILGQTAVGLATFDRGTLLGTITLRGGQIVYAASTADQDNATYAILGGTGRYVGATGTVATKTLDRAHVRVTITLAA
ncbi:MAG TPA: hypothetical protein VFA30_00605 [Gaiellaceae bacterium]|nr:hypothetical protein [Gaiellaceae bacterium]